MSLLKEIRQSRRWLGQLIFSDDSDLAGDYLGLPESRRLPLA